MFEDINWFFVITIISLIIVLIINNFVRSKKWLFAFNFLCLTESMVLTFYFGKFNYYFSLTLMLASLYYLFNLNIFGYSDVKNPLFAKSITSKFYVAGILFFPIPSLI